MAKAKRLRLEEAAAAAAAAAVAAHSDSADLEAEDEEVLEEVLEGLRKFDAGGGTVTWRVYCDVPRDGKTEGYVAKLRTEQLDETLFKNQYGPGVYRVVGKGSDGQYIKGAHAVIKISDIGATPAGAPAGGGGDPVALLREMRQADEARAAKRAEDLKTWATILAAPLGSIGAALIARPGLDVPALIAALRPQQSSLGELTTALTNLNQLQGERTGPLDMALKLLERIQDLPTSAGGDTGWLGIVRDFIREAAPAAREFLQTNAQRPSAPAQVTVVPTAAPVLPPKAHPGANGSTPPPSVSVASSGSPSAPSATAPASAPASDDPMLQFVEPWLRRKAEDLLEWAAENRDPELFAEVLVGSIPKTFRQFVTPAQLLMLLQSADWWERLTAFCPPIGPYRAWVEDCRSVVMELLQEEAAGVPPEGDTAPPTSETPQ